MRCTILGCGGSNGVPQIGCGCTVCTSKDEKDKRLRTSVLIENSGTRILIDSSPDLRQQALTHDINNVDAILYTHEHADHTAGIDDTRRLTKGFGESIPTYMAEDTYNKLTHKFRYVFYTKHPIYKPFLNPIVFKPYDVLSVNNIEFIPFTQNHGNINSYGFRFKYIAYSTDVKALDSRAFDMLRGVKVWVVDCMRYHWAPTHSHLDQTIGWIEKIKPDLAILTHMGHEIGYRELKSILPENIIPAYDGLSVSDTV